MEQHYQKIWRECLKVIRANVTPECYDAWFAPIVPLAYKDDVLTVQVKSQYTFEYIEAHYVRLIRSTLNKVLGLHSRLEYSVMMDVTDKTVPDVKIPSKDSPNIENPSVQLPLDINSKNEIKNPFVLPGIRKLKVESQLNEEYSFDNFVEGDCNRLARSAGYAVAEKPGKNAFNPMFIYSQPGLGKTHLCHAIGLEIKRRYPDKIVLYVNAEQFVMQFMSACKSTDSRNDFIRFYQMIDVLIVDDIQFLAGKAKTQDTFFQIFNHLQMNGKQLVFASDKAPVDLKDLEPRLLSRFKWGLTADLQAPDVETRKNILKRKAYNEGITLSEDVIEFLATHVKTNIREMDGFLISLIAHSLLNRKAATVELAKQMLDKFVSNSVRDVSVEYIISVVCQCRNISEEEFFAPTRKRAIVQARQLAMYFSKKYTKSSLANIGMQCGKKDHATVLHSIKTIEDLIETNREFRQIAEDVEKSIL